VRIEIQNRRALPLVLLLLINIGADVDVNSRGGLHATSYADWPVKTVIVYGGLAVLGVVTFLVGLHVQARDKEKYMQRLGVGEMIAGVITAILGVMILWLGYGCWVLGQCI